jgi:hypothetical protein
LVFARKGFVEGAMISDGLRPKFLVILLLRTSYLLSLGRAVADF